MPVGLTLSRTDEQADGQRLKWFQIAAGDSRELTSNTSELDDADYGTGQVDRVIDPHRVRTAQFWDSLLLAQWHHLLLFWHCRSIFCGPWSQIREEARAEKGLHIPSNEDKVARPIQH